MPQINNILPVLYEANQPYHHHYDNLPLKNILARIGMVNIQVDTNSDILRGAAGSAGTLSARLDVSLEESGALKTEAIDNALHSIEEHADTENYVRMTVEERTKLEGIGSRANKFQIEVEDTLPTVGNFVVIPSDEVSSSPAQSGIVRFRNSSTIFFDFISPDIIKAHSNFPPDVAHRHYYDLKPAYDNPSAPSYQSFLTNSLGTPFKEGTLRVYVNGVRLTDSSTETVHVLDLSDESGTWVETYISAQDYSSGTFSLSRALSANDVIRIDFDQVINPPEELESSSSSGNGEDVSSSSSS